MPAPAVANSEVCHLTVLEARIQTSLAGLKQEVGRVVPSEALGVAAPPLPASRRLGALVFVPTPHVVLAPPLSHPPLTPTSRFSHKDPRDYIRRTCITQDHVPNSRCP